MCSEIIKCRKTRYGKYVPSLKMMEPYFTVTGHGVYITKAASLFKGLIGHIKEYA